MSLHHDGLDVLLPHSATFFNWFLLRSQSSRVMKLFGRTVQIAPIFAAFWSTTTIPGDTRIVYLNFCSTHLKLSSVSEGTNPIKKVHTSPVGVRPLIESSGQLKRFAVLQSMLTPGPIP